MVRMRPYGAAKLICGVWAVDDGLVSRAVQLLTRAYGEVFARTPLMPVAQPGHDIVAREVGVSEENSAMRPLQLEGQCSAAESGHRPDDAGRAQSASGAVSPVMGVQQFVGFGHRTTAGQLPDAVINTAAVEEQLIDQLVGLDAIDVPVLTPGYVHPAKVVLAHRVDQPQRVYLAPGAFAEPVLWYGPRGWRGHPWTPPALLSHDGLAFVGRLRDVALDDARGVS